MKAWARRSLILLCCGGLLLGGGIVAVIGLGYWFFSSGGVAAKQKSAIECTLEWGRLAPFPASAGAAPVRTEGRPSSRAFRASFVATEAEIAKWLQDSPGTREAVVTKPTAGLRHFQIEPGGGAAHAEVTVDDTTHQVSIYVYWS